MYGCFCSPPGSFNPQPGGGCRFCGENLYSPSNASECLLCPTNAISSVGSVVCSCVGAGVSNSGFYLSNGKCIACPLFGADCLSASSARTQATLASLPGFWRVLALPNNQSGGVSGPLVFLSCPFGPAACPSSANGTCNSGYTGVLCAVCEPGFHATASGCLPCTPVSNYLIPVFVCVAICFIALFRWVSQRVNTRSFTNVVNIFIGWVQVMASASTAYNIKWPESFQSLINAFKVALFDVFQIASVDCTLLDRSGFF
jgi:hypothetical protein